MIYTHGRILFIHEKEEILLYATKRMNPENIMLSEIRQSYKDKYYMMRLT